MALPLREDEVARAVQIDLLRKATPGRRFALACSLSSTTIALARDGIRRRHPEWSEREVALEFVRVHYGGDLATKLRAYLANRDA